MTPIPDWLVGAQTSYWPGYKHLHIIPDSERPVRPAGTLDMWWGLLPENVQQYVICASLLTDVTESVDIGDTVKVHPNGEIVILNVKGKPHHGDNADS